MSNITIDDPYRIAIVMATQCRPSGKTPIQLQRAFETLINQVYQNWDLIIIGDKQEPIEELNTLVNQFKNTLQSLNRTNKVIYENNENTERNYIKNKNKLWMVAGANSVNMGLQIARSSGYTQYAHLDDDDYWSEKHLQVLMDVFKEHPNCIFAYTKSNFLKNRILPLEQYINQIYPNNLIARHGNACHSSIAFNIKELPVNYYSPINEHEIRHPADGKLLTDINRIMLLNEIQYQIYIPELTCQHIEEGQN